MARETSYFPQYNDLVELFTPLRMHSPTNIWGFLSPLHAPPHPRTNTCTYHIARSSSNMIGGPEEVIERARELMRTYQHMRL